MTTLNDASSDASSRAAPVGRVLDRMPWLSATDLAVLRIWLLSRCAVLALTWPALSIMQGSARASRPWLGLWQNWDAVNLESVARYGYFGPPGHAIANQVAFFPGFPIALHLTALVLRQWTVSGLLISFVAGGVAVVALGRVAELDYEAGSGSRAVLYLVASPAAIFLAVGYTEPLFLALALCSWLAARNDRWTLAVLLAGGACFVRVDGLFLCAALVIEILRRAHGQRVRALVMFVPALVPLAGYEIYLRWRTGDWLAWLHAEASGWDRHITNPVTTFHTTWTAGFSREFAAPINFVFQLEIVAVAVGLITTAALLWYRRWPEAVYTGLTVGTLATSVWYESVPRALLLLWPLWCGLAVASARRPWAGQLYLALSVPISTAIGLLFLTGYWAG
jgi:hypothetical protein